jgi:hypothetical protein
VPAAFLQVFDGVLGSAMNLLSSLAGVAAIAISAFLFTSLGYLLLDILKVNLDEGPERILISLGMGVTAFDLIVALGALTPKTRLGICAAVFFFSLLAMIRFRDVVRSLKSIREAYSALPLMERWLATVLGLVLFLEAFAAMAPLTGSDALHYHFAAPAQILKNGFHPNWFLQHSFLTGLSHELILAGLSLGSEKLAMGWIFLGGAATALAATRLTQKWVKGPLAYVSGLVFLLTPVTFWQVTTAGAPDIWMAFFLLAGILAIERTKNATSLGAVLVAGIMAGAIAGTKYTGIFFAGLLFIAFVVETRKLLTSVAFFCAALVTGCFPYLRNWLWTGDPVFPFLVRHLASRNVNSYALTDLLIDTGTSRHLNIGEILRFVSFSWIDQSNPGLWQVLGPIVLCFLPLIFLAFRWESLWRTMLLVCVGGTLCIGLTSAMPRFSLPLLPLALNMSVAGVFQLEARKWKVAELFAKSIVSAYFCVAFIGFVAYDRNNFAVAAGLKSRDSYLRSRAPDYQRSNFVNQRLDDNGEGRALVFFAHTYYLRVPYLLGHPSDSWAVDPSRLQSDEDWKQFFHQNDIRWVVRNGSFPLVLSESLGRLEKENIIANCGSGEVEDWIGSHVGGKIEKENMTIFCVAN